MILIEKINLSLATVERLIVSLLDKYLPTRYCISSIMFSPTENVFINNMKHGVNSMHETNHIFPKSTG